MRTDRSDRWVQSRGGTTSRISSDRGQAGVSIDEMFIDDSVICSERRQQASLKRWRYALERRGLTG